MNYDVVVATRNRSEALRIGIPLILNQSRAPKKLIVVDASDDHGLVNRTVTELTADSPAKMEIIHSQPNSAEQRNIGLRYVESPIVMFPDDDSLWWPGVAEGVMRVYERDIHEDIGGVCAAVSKEPPPGILELVHSSYQKTKPDVFRQHMEQLRQKIDDKLIRCPHPMRVHGRSRWAVRPAPGWLPQEKAVLTEYMGGFRMSFRTELIRSRGFDEDLGAHVGWAAYEDAELSFYVMQERLVVGTHNARVYHHKFPQMRDRGFRVGFINWFNCAYVVCRYAPKGSLARRAVKRYGIFKMLQYLLAVHSQYGRERFRGHWTALRWMRTLLRASHSELRRHYLEISEQVLGIAQG